MVVRTRWWLGTLLVVALGCTGELSSTGGTPSGRDTGPTERVDAGDPGEDASAPRIDAGTDDADAGEPATDAGSEGEDAGSPPPLDAGTDAWMPPPPEDAGMPDHCADGPLDAPLPDCRPTPPPSTGDIREDCVRRINQFRRECRCLPPLERWVEGESCADEHAEYDADGAGAHGGFRDRICSPGGSAQNECPGWGSETQVISGCLQAMWDEGPGEPFSEHGHYINMSSSRYSRVACGFHTTAAGRVWAVQNFR